MFSQYSWGDFFKVALPLVAIYYTYVAWVYFREDIREWISNRGQSSTPVAQSADTDEDDDDESIFTTRNYVNAHQPAELTAAESLEPAQWLPTVEPNQTDKSNTEHNQATPELVSDLAPEVELAGPAVADYQEEVFIIPVVLPAVNSAEQSIDELREAASRVAVDETGGLVAVNEEDAAAKRIAAIFNNQIGQAAFADFSFNR